MTEKKSYQKITAEKRKAEMQIIKKNIADLIPYANNSRKHSDKQIKQVASSIKEFGFLNPIIIDKDNGIIAGHCRVMACEKLGIKEVPCISAEHLTEAQKKAYIIADNQLALGSEWDMELLKVELEGLKELDFDVDLLGFDDIDSLLINADDFGEYFSLPDGDKEPFQQITFTLADEQAEFIKDKLAEVKNSDGFKHCETFGNENSNGNALYCILRGM